MKGASQRTSPSRVAVSASTGEDLAGEDLAGGGAPRLAGGAAFSALSASDFSSVSWPHSSTRWPVSSLTSEKFARKAA